MSGYAELQATSHFSFLRGASSPDELFQTAGELGLSALAVTDRNSLAGIVRAHVVAKMTGVRLVVGCRLNLQDGMSLLVYPMDRAGYSRLCRLLSVGKKRGGKAKCILHWSDVVEYGEGLLAVLVPDEPDDECTLRLKKLKAVFADRAYLALTLRRRPNDQLRIHNLANAAAQAEVLTLVTNDVLYHAVEREMLQDVVTCIRERCTIDELGHRRERHADRYLKPPDEMLRLFPRNTDAVRRTVTFMKRCRFSLDELAYQYPDETSEPGVTAQATLERLTWEHTEDRYPDGLPPDVEKALSYELALIARLEYAPYFLTVHSIVRFARSQGILCQGRGSAANSAVCFVLGVTSIDPARSDLLFERFVSEERREPPDIDIDFEHDRREIVIQWIFDHYGRNHAAICATVVRYQPKGAVRDVGKVLGLPDDMIRLMNTQLSAWSGHQIEEGRLEGLGINLQDRRVRLTLDLAQGLLGVPRHLSQHPGGFVLTNDRLDDLVPIEPAAMDNRQVIEWDKDDIDALKFMKVDVLALGMLTTLKLGLDFLADAKGIDLDLATIPAECPKTFAMIRKADTLGTFQIESRAQMAMLPRMKPRTFYDLVVEVAIVRPGPIQGDMVHPYLRRREGKEPVVYPTPQMERVLGKTLGVPLFQEQAMRVAIECAGFTPSEADQLRRSMATFKFTGGVSKYKEKLVGGMVERGYDAEFAGKVFSQLEGFGSYGFPESHAASFALLAYASSWLKCHHPDIFCAALLNSQPMGFYPVAQIVRDARDHNIEVRPICVNASRWDCTLEDNGSGPFAVRLGFRMAGGLANRDAGRLIAERGERPFRTVEEVWQRGGLSAAALTRLANADVFMSSLRLSRREALFAIKALRDEPLPLFAAARGTEFASEIVEPDIPLKAATFGSEIVRDYSHIGLSLKAHPVSLLRDELTGEGLMTCKEAADAKDGKYVRVAGLRLMCQKPGSANGTMFITLEDETGIANVVVWSKKYEEYRRAIISANMLMIAGRIQREGEVVHLIARSVADFSPMLASVGDRDDKLVLPHGRGDEFRYGEGGGRPDPRGIKVKTRNFR